jgi:hypothetical protein
VAGDGGSGEKSKLLDTGSRHGLRITGDSEKQLSGVG